MASTAGKRFTLRGLTQLLEFLPTLKPAEAVARVKVLWEALADLEARGPAAFYGSYEWGYFRETKSARFDATFIRTLNRVAWVPNTEGELVRPSLVVFDTLGWKSNPFLLTKITFKPPIIDQLAKEAGIDPAILDLLRRDPAIVSELMSRLSANPTPEPKPSTATDPQADDQSDGNVYDGAKDLYGDDMPDIPPGSPDPDGGDGVGTGSGGGGQGSMGTSRGGDHGGSSAHGTAGDKGGGRGKKTPGQTGGRPFISYVGTHPDDGGPDPDGIDQAERMRIENCAIDQIIGLEPALRRTPEGNPGFDLFETDSGGRKIRWVEVKSMTGNLQDRPVGLSRTQFDCAREKGDAYWLYVVEHATDPTQTRVLRIQNPVGHARTFTFDHGWRDIAR